MIIIVYYSPDDNNCPEETLEKLDSLRNQEGTILVRDLAANRAIVACVDRGFSKLFCLHEHM